MITTVVPSKAAIMRASIKTNNSLIFTTLLSTGHIADVIFSGEHVLNRTKECTTYNMFIQDTTSMEIYFLHKKELEYIKIEINAIAKE